jgi:hypothetical protein
LRTRYASSSPQRTAGPVEPVEDQDEIGLRAAANTIGTVLAKHGLLPGTDAAPEPERAADTTADSGSRGTR